MTVCILISSTKEPLPDTSVRRKLKVPVRNTNPAVSVKSDQIAITLAVGIHKKESYKAYTRNSWVTL